MSFFLSVVREPTPLSDYPVLSSLQFIEPILLSAYQSLLPATIAGVLVYRRLI